MFNNIQVVLVNPSHPGNIGAAARAMKTMRLNNLRLVAPLKFPHYEATVRAAGADDILAKASLFASLEEAVADCHWVYGTSAQQRHLPWPLYTPKRLALEVAQQCCASPDLQVAIVFGRERSGLDNRELALCQKLVCIPTNPDFSSLNLGAAVQVVCYELLQALTEVIDAQMTTSSPSAGLLATSGEMEGFYQHLQTCMADMGFMNPAQPKMLMQRLRHLFNRAELSQTEVNILRGFLKAVQSQVTRS